MGKLHKIAKKFDASYYLLDKDTFNSVHPLGTQAETAYDQAKAAEKAAKAAESEPVIPLPDEDAINRDARRRAAKRTGTGRASTFMSSDYGFGG